MNRRIQQLERALIPDGCMDPCHRPRLIETLIVDPGDDTDREVELCPRCGREAAGGQVTRILIVRPGPQERPFDIGGIHG